MAERLVQGRVQRARRSALVYPNVRRWRDCDCVNGSLKRPLEDIPGTKKWHDAGGSLEGVVSRGMVDVRKRRKRFRR